MPLDERSTDFRWTSPAGPFGTITDAQAAAFDEQGYFLFEQAFGPDEVAMLIAEIDPFEAETEAFLQRVDGGKVFIARSGEITFSPHLVRRSSYLREIVSSPVLTGLCGDLIGPDVRLYWDQAVYKKPGTVQPFPWHQDNGYTFVEPQQYLTCWIALTDATVDNGCPRVVPGLHRMGTLAHEQSDLGFVCLPEDTGYEAVEARAGDVVVFSSLTPHCTGANLTEQTRKSYIVQYAPDGAELVWGHDEPGSGRELLDDPDRQFPVLQAGSAIPPPQ